MRFIMIININININYIFFIFHFDKLNQLISFFDNYIRDSELQFMVITHRPVEFAQISNKNFIVSRDSEDDAGIARVRPVSYEELKSIYDKN